MIIIDRIIDMVEDMQKRKLIEKADRLIDKMDKWAVIEGMTDLYNDIGVIKRQLVSLNSKADELVKLKKKQLNIKKRGGKR